VAGHRKRRGGHAAEHENDERWLLTYADMITLLMALFMVLFSISSVNISKFVTLQQSLHQAFSGSILTGGRAIMQAGSESTAHHEPEDADVQTIVPQVPAIGSPKGAAAKQFTNANREQQDFQRIKAMLDEYASAHGFAKDVRTKVGKDGLEVQVLTDNLLFDSGSAALQPAGMPLLTEIANLVNVDKTHPVQVSGYTDDVPIHSTVYPTNWELSTARADTVVRYLISHDVKALRLSAAGYSYLHPADSNATATGRARNRRVEILLQRIYTQPITVTNG
jgi:chemotaxis protein MotB